MPCCIRVCVLSLSILLLASAGQALTITLDATDSGWYDQSGAHTASNDNYAAGWENTQLRNFFVFDVSGLPAGETILSATLRAYNPAVGEPNASFEGGYDSPDASETYRLVEVLTPAAVISLDSVGNLVVFNDLADGPEYGSYAFSAADNGTDVDVALNAAGLAALDAAIGDFVLGGYVSTLTGSFGTDEFVWGHTDPAGLGPYPRQLIVVLTPEPGTGALLVLGIVALAAARRGRA